MLRTFPPAHSSAVMTKDRILFGSDSRRHLYQSHLRHKCSSIMGRSPAKNVMFFPVVAFTVKALKHLSKSTFTSRALRLKAPDFPFSALPLPDKIWKILCATFCGATQNASAHCFEDGSCDSMWPLNRILVLETPCRLTHIVPQFSSQAQPGVSDNLWIYSCSYYPITVGLHSFTSCGNLLTDGDASSPLTHHTELLFSSMHSEDGYEESERYGSSCLVRCTRGAAKARSLAASLA